MYWGETWLVEENPGFSLGVVEPNLKQSGGETHQHHDF